MENALTFINRKRYRNTHIVYPEIINSPKMISKSKKCDSGTLLLYFLGYIACHCIVCPICIILLSPLFYFITKHAYPERYNGDSTNIPTNYPTFQHILNNFTL